MGSRKYVGKYQQKRRRRIPLASWLLIALAVFSLSTGAVVAYLSTATGQLTNTFVADQAVNPSISESFDNSTKSNVSVDVGNPGYAVYVRAAVVVTWKNGANVLGELPVVGTDYSIAYNTTNWFQDSDGFWYCEAPVNSGGSTPVLIYSCSPSVKAPADGYALNVEILAQTIQALGTTDEDDTPAVETAWPAVSVGADKNLQKAS